MNSSHCPRHGWLGNLPHGNTRARIQAAHVLVHPCRIESGAQATIEAFTSGTVEEPCNSTDKFSQVSVLVRRYAQGEPLIEAYWKWVRTPGQGRFVGEPLARPWAW